MPEWKEALVREEQAFEAASLPVILQGRPGSHAFWDKC
jgi:hypothetical protein